MVPRLPRHFEATVNRKYPTKKKKKKKETEALNKTVLVTFVLSHNAVFILLDFFV